jgi:hypothetical protein
MASNWKIPGGDDKGTPIDEASSDRLEYWIKRIGTKLASEPNGQYADKDRAWVAAAEAELRRRAGGGAPGSSPQAAPSPAARVPSSQLAKIGDGGLIKTATDAMQKIAELQGACHLVNSPAVGCGIPDGCAVAYSVTYINTARDTYPIKGEGNKVGLGKDALNLIAMGMGVQWDPVLSHRLDNGSDPHYCRYIAVGKMRDSDGTWITVFDEKENDLRDGSQQAKDMSEKQLAMQRLNIYSLTITKARNRAIRGRGVKCAYPAEELTKPFVAFKLVFTGESNDPEIRRMKARSMLESQSVLYGAPPAPPALLPPPPVSHITADGEVIDDDMDRGDDPNNY